MEHYLTEYFYPGFFVISGILAPLAGIFIALFLAKGFCEFANTMAQDSRRAWQHYKDNKTKWYVVADTVRLCPNTSYIEFTIKNYATQAETIVSCERKHLRVQ